MSAEMQSMLRYQAGRHASGEISADELARFARAYLERERGNKFAEHSHRTGRASLKADWKVLPGGALDKNP